MDAQESKSIPRTFDSHIVYVYLGPPERRALSEYLRGKSRPLGIPGAVWDAWLLGVSHVLNPQHLGLLEDTYPDAIQVLRHASAWPRGAA